MMDAIGVAFLRSAASLLADSGDTAEAAAVLAAIDELEQRAAPSPRSAELPSDQRTMDAHERRRKLVKVDDAEGP